MNERYLLILLAVLLLVSVGAFFLYVPILPVMATVVVPIGLIAMFSLGYRVGQNPAAWTGESEASPPADELRRAA
jgi:hypothetical protein